jgi:hypothetical protein
MMHDFAITAKYRYPSTVSPVFVLQRAFPLFFLCRFFCWLTPNHLSVRSLVLTYAL